MHLRIDIDTDRILNFLSQTRSGKLLKVGMGLGLILAPVFVIAAITKPYTFTDGTVVSASQINANFDTIVTEVNKLGLPRKLQRVVGQCNDGRDSGYLDCRKLTFTKTRDDTLVHFTWSDNRRGIGYIYGYWDVMWNRAECIAPAANRYWHHSYTTSSNSYNDNHYNATITGVCNYTTAGPMKAGTYDIEIRLTHAGGNNSDWYVGWNNSTFMIEAEEVY